MMQSVANAKIDRQKNWKSLLSLPFIGVKMSAASTPIRALSYHYIMTDNQMRLHEAHELQAQLETDAHYKELPRDKQQLISHYIALPFEDFSKELRQNWGNLAVGRTLSSHLTSHSTAITQNYLEYYPDHVEKSYFGLIWNIRAILLATPNLNPTSLRAWRLDQLLELQNDLMRHALFTERIKMLSVLHELMARESSVNSRFYEKTSLLFNEVAAYDCMQYVLCLSEYPTILTPLAEIQFERVLRRKMMILAALPENLESAERELKKLRQAAVRYYRLFDLKKGLGKITHFAIDTIPDSRYRDQVILVFQDYYAAITFEEIEAHFQCSVWDEITCLQTLEMLYLKMQLYTLEQATTENEVALDEVIAYCARLYRLMPYAQYEIEAQKLAQGVGALTGRYGEYERKVIMELAKTPQSFA